MNDGSNGNGNRSSNGDGGISNGGGGNRSGGSGDTILRVQDLQTHFFTRTGVVKAVDGISFELRRGETLGIVGESGSGKSMTAWSILGMVPHPGRIVGGSISYLGENLLEKSRGEMRDIRGSGICMVMQDPLTSLNPVFTVGDQLTETLRLEYHEPRRSLRKRAAQLLANVRIPAPEERLTNFPHQMERRDAAAGGGRHFHRPRAQPADCGRTHHLAGRHHPAAIPAAAEGHSGADGGGHHLYHPRFRHSGADVRPGGGDVRRADCGAVGCGGYV